MSIKSHLNTIRFGLKLKEISRKKINEEQNLTELIKIAEEERGILFKLLQYLFPEKISNLKTQNQALSNKKVISIIEKELNIKFHEHFTYISEPIYCASIGQVHKAKLKINKDIEKFVAIKIQYPHIKRSIESQIKFLKLATLAEKIGPVAKWNIAINSHLQQIECRLKEELDYRHELNNLQKAQDLKILTDCKSLIALESYCTSSIFTQLWIDGFNLNYIKSNWDISTKKLVALNLVEQYLKQVLITGFFQGDTNFTNFIINENGNVHWIDFGNWCTLSNKVQNSLLVIIIQTINNEDINYLGHFENIGFDLTKLRYLQNSLPLLVSIIFEPFFTNRPFDLSTWKLEERIDNLLGENKWWFRSSGDSHFLELMKSFYGIIEIVKFLNVNINWQNKILQFSSQINISEINRSIPYYNNNIPTLGQLAKNLIIQIFKNSIEHIKIELPATSLLDLENFIPEDIKPKLIAKSLDINKIKFSYLENGLIPGEVFNFEDSNMTFHIYLT